MDASLSGKKPGKSAFIKNGQTPDDAFSRHQRSRQPIPRQAVLGLALDPNFATNGYVYLAYVYEGGGNPNDQGPKSPASAESKPI